MLIITQNGEEVRKIILPKDVKGNFWLYYQGNKKLVSVEGREQNWHINSNSQLIITDLLNNKVEEDIILKEYDIYMVRIPNSTKKWFIYCLPVYEDDLLHLHLKYPNEMTIGKSSKCDIQYNHSLVSDLHAKIYFSRGRWIVENYDKNFGVIVNGNRLVTGRRVLSNGDTVFIIGLKMILMGKNIFINNPKNKVKYSVDTFQQEKRIRDYKIIEDNLFNDGDDEESIEYYSSSPRINSSCELQKISIEPPPSKNDANKMPQILTIGSTISMGVISLITCTTAVVNIAKGESTLWENISSLLVAAVMLISMLVFPLLMTKWQNKMEKRVEENRLKKYKAYLNSKNEQLNKMKKENKDQLLRNFPTTEECTQIILNKEERLWERKIEDEDFTEISLGLGDKILDDNIFEEEVDYSLEKDSLKELYNEFKKKASVIEDVPIRLSFAKEKIVGMVDENNYNMELFLQKMLIQLITFQNYEELKLIFLLRKDRILDWKYIKMLPYTWSNDNSFRFLGTDYSNNLDDVSAYLEKEFKERGEKKEKNKKDETVAKPFYLIITDDYKSIEDLKIISEIVSTEENRGFGLFCMGNTIRELPTQCKTVVKINKNEGEILRRNSTNKEKFYFKNDSIFFLDNLVQTIANIPIKMSASEKNSFPENYSFLDMFGVNTIEELNIPNRWNNNNSTLSLAAPIGVDGNGKIINLDIHEKAHGPHGLVAGSTGSGKSEFIITYILSLAVNYHPDDVAFVLIDYKGGGLTGAFQKGKIKLPHIVGTITNIDSAGLQRSLVSIRSELKRRQILFNEARELTNNGTIDIYKYQKLYHEGALKEALPHLLIICDEFAELKQQQPDFMDELVSVSRIGRSLGVHLILATQKPSGIVDDQIRSNSKFAVCLKVQDKSDSNDMIGNEKAAFIKQSGRFYFKVGNDEYFVMGQSGWSGAQYVPLQASHNEEDNSIKFISNTGSIIKEITDTVRQKVKSQGEQLTKLVEELYNLSQEKEITPKQLWLESLPNNIYLDVLKSKYKYEVDEKKLNVVMGEYDDPSNQHQDIAKLDISAVGNIAIFGGVDSGKESLLNTMIYELISSYSSKRVWTYILDFGSETFKIFKNAAHVGDVMFTSEAEKISRFFGMIKEEARRRKEELAEYNGNYELYLNTSGNTMPMIIIIINGFENFSEKYLDMYDELLLQLTREGKKVGITFITTTTSINDFRYRLLQNFRQRVALVLNDENDYSSIFDGLGKRKPARTFGRGMIELDEEVYEFQMAKICDAENYNGFIKEEIEKINYENELKAPEIKILPSRVKKEDLEYDSISLDKIPIGMTSKELKTITYDFKNNFFTLIMAKDLNDAAEFTHNIMELMLDLEDVDVQTLDTEKLIVNDSKDLSEKYKQVREILKKKQSKHLLLLICGVEKFLNLLEDRETEFMEMLREAQESSNCSVILVENGQRIRDYNCDEWYGNYISGSNNMIWVGDGVDNQYILELHASNKDIVDDCGCTFGYTNIQNRTIMVKLLEMKEKEED